MMGLMSLSAVSFSMEMVSSAFSSSRMTSSAKFSPASSSTRCDCSVFFSTSLICVSVATLVTMRRPRFRLISSIIINWLGSAIAITRRPSCVSCSGTKL